MRGYRIPLITPIVDLLERKHAVPGKGTLFFLLAVFVCLFFFPVALVVPAILTLAIVDGVATPVGIHYGKHGIINGKTAEGTVGGIVAAAIVLLVVLSPLEALFIAIIGGIVELVTPVDDNLVIPVVVCCVMTIW
jgi:dolichol kinase